MVDGEAIVPREVAEQYAKEDPTVASMIRRGIPLSRNAYLAMAWGTDLPHPDDWNAEHEMEVPKCFRDPDAVKHDPRKKGAQNACQD
jgi:hypothetical protein